MKIRSAKCIVSKIYAATYSSHRELHYMQLFSISLFQDEMARVEFSVIRNVMHLGEASRSVVDSFASYTLITSLAFLLDIVLTMVDVEHSNKQLAFE